MTEVIRVSAPHFVAMIVRENGKSRAAPIVRYMRDWPLAKIEDYARKKGWTVDAKCEP